MLVSRESTARTPRGVDHPTPVGRVVVPVASAMPGAAGRIDCRLAGQDWRAWNVGESACAATPTAAKPITTIVVLILSLPSRCHDLADGSDRSIPSLSSGPPTKYTPELHPTRVTRPVRSSALHQLTPNGLTYHNMLPNWKGARTAHRLSRCGLVFGIAESTGLACRRTSARGLRGCERATGVRRARVESDGAALRRPVWSRL